MQLKTTLLLALTAGAASAQETVLGVYIFSRHGDRTAKSTPPTNLTDLGYEEIFTSGTYFRNQYIAANATSRIRAINTDLVKLSQLNISAPVDNVLQNSALGFTQALYPPVGPTLGTDILRNGTTVQAPLNGYQLIPIQIVSTGSGSEDSAWLQGATNCPNAQLSSNEFFSSPEYIETLNATQAFYNSIAPMVNRTFAPSQTSYLNAYTIWDLLNVASIHNASDNFPSAQLLTPETFYQLRILADRHEFNLAYNSSAPIRAITGAILAAQVVQALNLTITSAGKSKLNIQFGAYAGFQSFFGLANLTSLSQDFFGVPDYASTMTWELVTNATLPNATSFPTPDQISVRFLFHNGTTSPISTPTPYPLFGQPSTLLSWSDFASGMNQFAVGNQNEWCQVCGNTAGVCASSSNSTSTASGASSSSTSTGGSGGISKAVAGVIGAMVTLGVILAAELLIILVAGLRLVSKKRFAAGNGASPNGGAVKA